MGSSPGVRWAFGCGDCESAMIDPEEALSDVPQGTAICGVCDGSLPAARYVHVDARSVLVLCSAACFREVVREDRRARWAERRRRTAEAALVIILGSTFLTPHGGPPGHWRIAHAAPAPLSQPRPLGPAPLPAGWFGPEWPPSETSFLASLGQDAWIHPLSGPVRRMPRADSRVFGAVRPGERPAECRNGHCGVDLGGEIWGEQVHAVHEGVVDFVQRSANPDRGGEFVRVAHRDGTVFTWYFHLAAIRNGLERGMHVKSGEVIGLLGDTGVKESAPHLHFAISVRPWKDGPERYLDPEPLIALWPVRVPVEGGEAGLVTTLARPGMPLGSALLSSSSVKKRRAAALAKLKRGGPHVAGATSDDGAAGDQGDSSGEATGDGDAASADRGAGTESTPPATGDE
jgi:murein DD-endopeptidase MepM/ murein hydrolase activator NlpD